jgi:hypothetical protein
MPIRFHKPPDWPAWRNSGPPLTIGGSQVPKRLGYEVFKGDTIAEASALAGHALEPLVLKRLHAYLTALGHDLDPFEQGWVAEDAPYGESEGWRRGSFDGISWAPGERGIRPVAGAEIKIVMLGQLDYWRFGSEHVRPDGLARHVEIQSLWYQDLAGCPWYVAMLRIPAYGLGMIPPEAWVQIAEMPVWTLRPEETADDRAAMVSFVSEWRDAELAGRKVTADRVYFEGLAPRQKIIGGMEDGRLLARYHETGLESDRLRDESRTLTEAARAIEVERELLKSEIRTRVGAAVLVAGGWRATMDGRGAIRVRRER